MAAFDLPEDRAFQRRFWRLQRGIWIVFVLVLAAALLGFAGAGGLWSETTITTAHAEIRAPRVSRWQTTDRIVVSPTSEAPLTIELSEAFLELYTIEALTPEPLEQEPAGSGVRYRYAPAGGGQIAIAVEPQGPALGQTVSMRINGQEIRMRAVVLP